VSCLSGKVPVGRRSLSSLVLAGATVALVGCGGIARRTAASASTTTTKTTTVQPSSPGDPLPKLVAKTQSAVVRIEASGGGSESIGTGFLIGPRLVATVEHVVDGATSITLKQNGRAVATGTVIGDDPARDVALVQASKPLTGTVLPLATRAPLLGESVAALGFPLGLPLTVTQGSVSGLQRTVPIDGLNRRDMVQTDAAVNPGNSGGPLLSVDTGDVVGLVDLGATQANGIAFAVSAQVAQPLLQAWRAAPQQVPTACGNPTTTTSTQPSVPTPPPPTPQPATPASTQTYNSQAFSIDYPSSWQVQDAEQQESYGTDTTFVSPTDSNTTLKVDVSQNTTASSPQSAAQPVINATEQSPGYQQLDLSSTTFDGFPAVHWEFVLQQSGELVQKEDIFFIDSDTDEGVAVLTSAPAGQYSALASDFSILRVTLSMN
jgi:S1-C subfamily serine protease